MILETVLVFFPTLLPAQEASPALEVRAVTRSDGAIQAIVHAMDGQGRPLGGLTAANFSATLEGKQLEIVSAGTTASSGQPLSLALMLDVSGSMKGEAMREAVRAAEVFLGRMQAEDWCAVLSFGSQVRTLHAFSKDRAASIAALRALAATERDTRLLDGLFQALDMVSSAPTKRAAVVVLTDGRDEGSAIGLQDVLTKAALVRVPIYTVGFGAKADRQVLLRLGLVSKGAYFDSPQPKDLTGAFDGIAKGLFENYSLRIRMPQGGNSGQLQLTLRHLGQNAVASGTVPPPAGGQAVPVRAPTPGSPVPWRLAGVGGLLLAATGGSYLLFRKRMRARFDPVWRETMKIQNAWIEVVRGADAGLKIRLQERETLIGRNPSRVQFALKNDPMIGKVHARISLNEREEYVIEDLGSQNGISVNGVRVFEPVVLRDEDKVTVGLSELLFIDKREA